MMTSPFRTLFNGGYQPRGKRGFTMIEMLVVLVIVAIIAAIAGPGWGRFMRNQRVNKAATLVANDLQNAFSLAARQRKPVQLNWATGSTRYTIKDRASTDTLIKRELGAGSEYGLSSISFSPGSVVMFPNGISSAAVTVSLNTDGRSKTVTASTAGFVRVSQ